MFLALSRGALARLALVVKRVSNVITLNGSGSTITMTASYSGDSALSACAVQLIPDSTNFGVNVAATGLASTTLHWPLDARVQEVV